MVCHEKMVTAKGRERRFGPKATDEEILKGIDLSGKTVLITGTTSGIGKETARVLATHGAHVVMLNRNKEDAQKVRDEIYSETSNRKIDLITCDLASLKSVKAAADRFVKKGWPLQVLILNAAVASPPEHLSKDGYNATFAVNYLAHFYLTLLLKDKFTITPPSRVVVLSSELHRQARIDPRLSVDKKLELLIPSSDTTETALTLYSRSKLCNILFAFKLHRELSKIGVNVNAVHPGFIETGLVRSVRASVNPLKAVTLCRFAKTIQQGAATSVYGGFHPDLDKISGHYFEDCWDDRSKLAELANDEKLQDALWKKSIDMINEASLKF